MRMAAPPHVAHVESSDTEIYRVTSIEPVRAPEGCAGPDWFAYRIARGTNGITGYRRGSSESVRAEAETIVIALNERRAPKKSKPSAKAHGRTSAPSVVAEPSG